MACADPPVDRGVVTRSFESTVHIALRKRFGRIATSRTANCMGVLFS
jgi:hypothetical protein